MRSTRLTRQITTYRVKTADPGEHHLLIEHPRLVGWSLTAPDPTHVELSANAYRIPVTLPGDTQGTLAVTMEHPLEETIRLLDLTDDRLGVLVASNELEPSVRKCARGARFAAASAWTAERRAREAEGATSSACRRRKAAARQSRGGRTRYGAIQADARQARRNRSDDHDLIRQLRKSCRRDRDGQGTAARFRLRPHSLNVKAERQCTPDDAA